MSNGSTDRSTIVLIHGLWMTALSWEHWVTRYEAAGHRVIARSWPGMEADITEFRRDPSAVDHLGLEDIVDHYDGDHRAGSTWRRSSWATRSAAHHRDPV